MRGNPERDDQILNMWAAGKRCADIATEFNLGATSICGIVGRARKRGDPRAVARRHNGSIRFKEIRTENAMAARRRSRKRALSERFPATQADLAAVIAQSTVPVTKLGLGAHLGWRPAWLR